MPLGRVRTRTTVAKATSSVVGALKVEDGIVRNVETSEEEGRVDDLSGVLKKEVTNPRKDTPFVVLVSLLATLALARGFVLLTGAAEATTETSTYLGRNLIINGYHIHHFFYGFFFFQAEDGIRDLIVTGVQTCALPISSASPRCIACTTSGAPPNSGTMSSNCLRFWMSRRKARFSVLCSVPASFTATG